MKFAELYSKNYDWSPKTLITVFKDNSIINTMTAQKALIEYGNLEVICNGLFEVFLEDNTQTKPTFLELYKLNEDWIEKLKIKVKINYDGVIIKNDVMIIEEALKYYGHMQVIEFRNHEVLLQEV